MSAICSCALKTVDLRAMRDSARAARAIDGGLTKGYLSFIALPPTEPRPHRHDPQAAPQRLPLPRFRADAALLRRLSRPAAGAGARPERNQDRPADPHA